MVKEENRRGMRQWTRYSQTRFKSIAQRSYSSKQTATASLDVHCGLAHGYGGRPSLVCLSTAEPRHSALRIFIRYLNRDREGGQTKPLMESIAYQAGRTALTCQDCNPGSQLGRFSRGGFESWVAQPVPSVGSCCVSATKGKARLNLVSNN